MRTVDLTYLVVAEKLKQSRVSNPQLWTDGLLEMASAGIPAHVVLNRFVERMNRGVSGVLVGCGVLRNPWILSQAAALAAGDVPEHVSLETRGRFLLEYIDLLLQERVNEAEGFRHVAPGVEATAAEQIDARPARGRERWVINKLRALCAWYSKGLDGGGALRVSINSAGSIAELRTIVQEFFLIAPPNVATDELLSSRR